MHQSNSEFFNITQKVKSAKDAFMYNCKIDPGHASELIQRNILENSAEDFSNTTQQGNALEEVVDYFLNHCGAFEDVERNDKNKLHDIDHWANFSFYLGDHLLKMGVDKIKFIGESKNYLNSRLKVDIAYKVEGLKLLISAGVGCYFTRSGLKGKHFSESAKGVVFQFNSTFKNYSIVFTDKDWIFLKDAPLKFGALVYQKLLLCSNQNDTEVVDYEKI